MANLDNKASAMKKKNSRMVVGLLTVIVSMLGLVVLSIPLYDIFCRVTGYKGFISQQEMVVAEKNDRVIKVRFDANISSELNWEFTAPSFVEVSLGEVSEVFFYAVNKGSKGSRGMAMFNVVPVKAAPYFVKLTCFCSEDKAIKPQSKSELPVVFYIDPEINNISSLDDVDTITLSYSFFVSE